ncbi:MAG: threonine-phosphate decarboxylase [Candidatus Rokuibacteriota bacterium]|nr:MAG: threonine-phosphate decarboxylase [Candidatus Rokubacteria bacterium]
MRRDHGGNLRELLGARDRPAGPMLDLSASINPLGASPQVIRALLAALPSITRYPDPEASALVEALSRYHDVPARHVVAGHGSTELIYLLARALAPRRALVVHPAFSEYEAALEPLGCAVERVVGRGDAGWIPPRDALLERVAQVDLVVLANPSNPTGALAPAELLEELAAACAEARVSLVVDEAFIDFVEGRSLKSTVSRRPWLGVLRSLTKFFALPGLRVGYALLGERLRERVEGWREPWSVSALAEAAGIAALADRAYRAQTLRVVPAWRAALCVGLERLGGLRVYPSVTNYLLVGIERPGLTAAALAAALLRDGIAIRSGASFPGLGPNHVRIAVPRPEDQQVLLAALAHRLEP